MDLSREQITSAADRYADEVDGFEEEVEQLERLPRAFADGSWERADLKYIIEWKALRPYQKKALNDLKNNPERKVEIAIEDVLDTHAVVQKLARLRDIKGVGLPMATAVLLFMNPRAYTVLDKNAWTALHNAGHLYSEPKNSWEPDDYLRYLGVCHALANELGVQLRTLDRALWVLGR